MKLLFCEDCGDITAPNRDANVPRWCRCKRHAVWWTNPVTGDLRLHDRRAANDRGFVLGITNAFLYCPARTMDAPMIAAIIDRHPDYFLFKQQRSCIIRFRPGETDDSAWAPELPDASGGCAQ